MIYLPRQPCSELAVALETSRGAFCPERFHLRNRPLQNCRHTNTSKTPPAVTGARSEASASSCHSFCLRGWGTRLEPSLGTMLLPKPGTSPSLDIQCLLIIFWVFFFFFFFPSCY